MKMIIAGGRDFDAQDEHWLALDELNVDFGISEVVSGGCSGADEFGECWANSRNIPVRLFKADWKTHKRAAGPIRNRKMAEYANALVAFKGGKGTNNMVKEAEKAGLHFFDRRDY